MRFVLDASVAATWCFDDEDDGRAQHAFELLASGATAITPALFWFEVRNAVLVGVRKSRIDLPLMADVLVRIDRADILTAIAPDQHSIFALALKHRLTFYDASYLELAQRERLALATLDTALVDAATAEGIPLIGA